MFREHIASSTDSTSTTVFTTPEVNSSTVKLSDNMQISISGCTVGDIVTFTASRTGDNHQDLDDFKMAVYDSDGASTAAYDSSGNLKSGASETAAVTTTTARSVAFSALSASGLKRYRLRLKCSGDGSANNTQAGGGIPEQGNMIVKVTVANTSGNTITAQTLYDWDVTHNPLI